MNALELADKLENKDRLWNVDENLMIKTCAMLRQQQAKIDTYRLQNSSQIDTHKYKPVAWMQHHYETGKVTKFSPVKVWEDDIPLYLHPAKTLTDEEIEQIGKEYGIKSVYQFAYYEFARAILRKASEK